MTIQSLAKELYEHTETKFRENGAEFIVLTEDAPDWAQDVTRAAHGDLLPDDWRYKFIVEACQAIIEYEGDRDSAQDSLEADTYYSDLTQWLASHLSRLEYCNEVLSNGYNHKTIDSLLMTAQWYEKTETFNLLYDALEALATEQEAA